MCTAGIACDIVRTDGEPQPVLDQRRQHFQSGATGAFVPYRAELGPKRPPPLGQLSEAEAPSTHATIAALSTRPTPDPRRGRSELGAPSLAVRGGAQPGGLSRRDRCNIFEK